MTFSLMKFPLDDVSVERFLARPITKRFTVSDQICRGLSLELRPSGEGSWRYRYTYEGKQECLTIGVLSVMKLNQARKQANEIASRIHKGENPVGSLRSQLSGVCPTLREFVDDFYLPHIRSYKRCVTADITLLDNHLIPAFGRYRLNSIARNDILNFQREKMAAGYKPAYCNRFLVLLSFCFNLAIKWEISGVTKNPVKLVPLLKANNKVERFMTKEESARLLLAINGSPNPLLRYFVLLALLTGMRKREILDARWQDIDWDRGLWFIPQSKSGTSRHVPLTKEAVSVLRDLQKKLPELLEQGDLLENPWIIPNWRTGKPFKSIFNSWDTARQKAGLADLRIHDLRHSFASALVNQGVPIYDVQKLLGHQDIKTTQRYAHFSTERLRSSSSVLSEFYDLNVEV